MALGTQLYGALRRQLVRWMIMATLALSLVSVGLIGYTANLGGKIDHPELRSVTTVHTA